MTEAERIVEEILSAADLLPGFSLTAEGGWVVMRREGGWFNTRTGVDEIDGYDGALDAAASAVEDCVTVELTEPWFPFSGTLPPRRNE